MMNIDIQHLAKLSRLKFSPAEEVKFAAEMKKIVELVEKLPNLDASGALIDPNNPMTLRPDTVENSPNRKELLQNAPETQAGCIVVPKVVE